MALVPLRPLLVAKVSAELSLDGQQCPSHTER
jgi:hypothetical protein